MPRRSWEFVVIVVLAFSVTEHAADEIVSRLIGVGIILAAEGVANRVDRPSYVMNEEDSRQATPQQT